MSNISGNTLKGPVSPPHSTGSKGAEKKESHEILPTKLSPLTSKKSKNEPQATIIAEVKSKFNFGSGSSDKISKSKIAQSKKGSSKNSRSSKNSQSKTGSSKNSQSKTASSKNSQSKTASSKNSQSKTASSTFSQSKTGSSGSGYSISCLRYIRPVQQQCQPPLWSWGYPPSQNFGINNADIFASPVPPPHHPNSYSHGYNRMHAEEMDYHGGYDAHYQDEDYHYRRKSSKRYRHSHSHHHRRSSSSSDS